MPRRKSGPIFVTSSITSGPRFKTGEQIPESGIYRVVHKSHRLPHDVTLYEKEIFPRCAKCHEHVTFELLHPVPAMARASHRFRVHLYQLPEINDAEEAAAV